VLLPPNLNVLSVQWTPYGGGYQVFSVDFSAPPNTDWHVLTACANQTTDAQSGAASGGCELQIDPISWSRIVDCNRGGGPVTITVRGTTDGRCVSTSTNSINVSFAEEDLLGSYYYWKSSGVGGQVWKKTFGDLNMSEQDVTSPILSSARCNGCHTLSRDGTRLIVYADDNDSNDEYRDLAGWLLDTSATPASTIAAGPDGGPGAPSPGFTAIHSLNTYYVTSNGLPSTSAGTPSVTVPVNGWSLWNGDTGALVGGVAIGALGTRPTMPDWSIDGTSIVYVQPSAVARWSNDVDGGAVRSDDTHIFGGSLYTVSYLGDAGFGAPAVFLQSNGENNYYPSYSPDQNFAADGGRQPPALVLFNRVANDANAGTSCSGGYCPNDSFSNPAARLMLMANAAGSKPIDLEMANGSPASAPAALSNSYPRWAPFVTTYHGQMLLWLTFSSTRDYGVRLLNHKPDMRPCYPAGTPETPTGTSAGGLAAECQQPQLWMAPVFASKAQGYQDPSGPAFWLPYQDITTHNHGAQWVMLPASPKGPPPPQVNNCQCSMLGGPCGSANPCGCCVGYALDCNGNGICIDTGR
jgi:hypothetical protein